MFLTAALLLSAQALLAANPSARTGTRMVYDESKGLVAHNAVHHSKQFPSQITVTVLKRPLAQAGSGSR